MSPVNDAFLTDLNDFARRFTCCDMKRAEWTHEAHLAVGVWHVDRYGAEGALARLRTGIRALNESFGNRNTAADGYHETITAAYVRLITDFLNRGPAALRLEERVVLLVADERKDEVCRHIARLGLCE